MLTPLPLPWATLDTVLLDMDGTLLDLNFDNHFWQEFVPLNYAKLHGLSLEAAKQQLAPQFKKMEGQLEWYCLDYWSQELHLDISGLKAELAGLIAVLPHVTEFLTLLRQSTRRIILVTNAHRDSLGLKMEKTCLQHFFDHVISSHDFGVAKENAAFWPYLQQVVNFDAQRTLMVDDSIPVLRAAHAYGIGHLITISRPDSQRPKKAVEQFTAIEDFRELLPGLLL